MAMTGDPRRWASEPGYPGVIHFLDPWHANKSTPDSASFALERVAELIELEGPSTIAAMIVEPVSGTNGILIPPDGYLEGLRDLCKQNGILFIADEVMTGFGRTGAWFAVDHWGVVPDMLTMGKGLTSSYLPLGGVAVSSAIADILNDTILPIGQTHNAHPLCCVAALAVLEAYQADGLVERARAMGELMRQHHDRLRRRHAVISDARSIGLFGVLELSDPRTAEPMAPFNGTSSPMKFLAAELRRLGLFTIVRWNMIMTNPPLCISEDELAAGFDMIDRALVATEAATAWKH
jgi:taurine--2-oxoglutarate transaminase